MAGTLHLAQTGPRVTQVPAAKWEWCKELSDDHNTDREYDLLWGLYIFFGEARWRHYVTSNHLLFPIWKACLCLINSRDC